MRGSARTPQTEPTGRSLNGRLGGGGRGEGDRPGPRGLRSRRAECRIDVKQRLLCNGSCCLLGAWRQGFERKPWLLSADNGDRNRAVYLRRRAQAWCHAQGSSAPPLHAVAVAINGEWACRLRLRLRLRPASVDSAASTSPDAPVQHLGMKDIIPLIFAEVLAADDPPSLRLEGETMATP